MLRISLSRPFPARTKETVQTKIAASTQDLHCLPTECSIKILIKMKKKHTQKPLKHQWTGLFNQLEIPFGIHVLGHSLNKEKQLDAFDLARAFIISSSSCMQAANALERLCVCTGLSESSLLAYYIRYVYKSYELADTNELMLALLIDKYIHVYSYKLK